ncbi:MAG: OsmC family protein [Verrucomicrobiales bacterium]
MVSVSISYQGDLHCLAVHGPSGSQLPTDAPRDNMGRGEAFSPTDLLATSLGTCMLTTLAIAAVRKGIDLAGASAQVEKQMSDTPPRRIAKIAARFIIPLPADHPERPALEAAARSCPVHRSLHPDVVQDVTFEWNEQAH